MLLIYFVPGGCRCLVPRSNPASGLLPMPLAKSARRTAQHGAKLKAAKPPSRGGSVSQSSSPVSRLIPHWVQHSPEELGTQDAGGETLWSTFLA